MGREGTFVSVFINICSMAITADTYRNRSGRQWTALNVAHCPASTKQHRSVGGLFDYRLNCLFGEYFGPAVITVNLVQSSRIWSMLFNENKKLLNRVNTIENLILNGFAVGNECSVALMSCSEEAMSSLE